MTVSTLLILSFLAAARAYNDWTKPCLSGICSYDLPSTNGSTASGSMQISADTGTAIGDITEAAGWKILGCDPDVLTQDIRLVCMADEYESMCQHLYAGHGAVDTIVRLPESCGKGPFARIAKAWVPADQSIPPSIAARIVRRDGQPSQVQAVTLDTNYAAANNTKTGAVNLAIQGINVPGLNSIIVNDTAVSRRRTRLNRRQLSSFVSNAASAISNAVSSANTIDINKSQALPAADFSKKATLFDTSVSCPPVTAKVSVDVDATAHAVVTLGVAASGTIVPPKISDFSLIASLTADINGELDMTADLSGSLDSGTIKLFETGIPGLDFPGILSIGPTFEVNANAKATLDLSVDMTVGINYHIDGAQLVFPPGSGSGAPGAGSFQLGDTPLKLSADTKAAATGTVEAHLIPSINLGLSALGVVDATVSLDLDASATMQLTVQAQAGASETIQQANRKRQDDSDDTDADDSDDGSDDSDDDGSDDSDDDGSDDSVDDGSDDTTDDGSDDSVDDGSDDSVDDGSDDTDADAGDDADSGDDSLDSGDADGSDPTADDTSDATDDSGDADDTSDGVDTTDDTDDSGDAAPTDDGDDTADDGSDADPTDDSDDTAVDDGSDTTDSADADPADGSSDDSDTAADDGSDADSTSDGSADGTDDGDDTTDDTSNASNSTTTGSDDGDGTGNDDSDTVDDTSAPSNSTTTGTDSTDGDTDDDSIDDPSNSNSTITGDDTGASSNDTSTDPSDFGSSNSTDTDDQDLFGANNGTDTTGASGNDTSTDPSDFGSSNSTDTDPDLSGANNATDPTGASGNDTSTDPSGSSNSTDPADATNSTTTTSASALPTSASATATSTSSAPLVSATGKTDATFGGTFTISAGLDLSAGASGSFFGLFDDSTKVSLFKKDFDLLTKSFGDSGDGDASGDDSDSDSGDDSSDDSDDSRRSFKPRQSAFARRRALRHFKPRATRAQRFALVARGLSCLTNSTDPVSLADETVPGESL